MSDNKVPQGFPGFAPGEDRALLADVNRWRRQNGWTLGDIRGWINGRFTAEATTAVDWRPADENPDGFTVTHRDERIRTWPVPDFYRATSVRQAVDLLVALGILPPVFTLAYQTGRNDGHWVANVDSNPARRCHSCGATSGLKQVFGPFYTHAGWECRDGCTEVAR